jgi:3-deoxy-manno-octulosonate cytidylyltransferase (CMP-KDO synthetase)
MNLKKILILIPARYESSRFPGKPLVLVAGKSMIQRVYENCQKANESDEASRHNLHFHVGIVTDNREIETHVKGFAGNVYRVDDDVPSGSERIYLAYERFFKNQRDFQLLVNVQGDEPLLKGERIAMLASFHLNSSFDLATMVKPMKGPLSMWQNPNCVKAIYSQISQKCLYFSRAPIPFVRNPLASEDVPWHLHIGVYSYKLEGLKKFHKAQSSPYENYEQLEQLRALELGLNIGAIEVDDYLVGIDTPEDVKKAEGVILGKEIR